MDHNFLNLRDHILPQSVATTWEEAKREWVLDSVEILESDEETELESCPCGHFPIVELCWIRNQVNDRLTFVGNVCVRRFMDVPADTVADGFKRIMKDIQKPLNPPAIAFAHAQGWIGDWSRTFYLDTCRKRKLSSRQLVKRVEINRQLIDLLRRRLAQRKRGLVKCY